jgi:hypothetical protein
VHPVRARRPAHRQRGLHREGARKGRRQGSDPARAGRAGRGAAGVADRVVEDEREVRQPVRGEVPRLRVPRALQRHDRPFQVRTGAAWATPRLRRTEDNSTTSTTTSTTALLALIDWEALPAATRQTIRTIGDLMQEGCSQSEMARRLKLPEARVAAMRREMRDAIVAQAVARWTSSSRHCAASSSGSAARSVHRLRPATGGTISRPPNGIPGWQTPTCAAAAARCSRRSNRP